MKVGKILPNGTIEKEFHGQGHIYKDWDAFENKTDEICYAGEYDDEGQTYKDIVDVAQEFIDRNEEVQEYIKSDEGRGITAHDMALDIFEMIDWQHPETITLSWEDSGAYTE
tara:strand:+ start:343 stop:678 length:336 start_codon:yes stop_codon:yes gene_type:complete